MTPEDFSTSLVRWHERHGRRDLPWQQEPSPYRVWVSEVMLQQTQVSTVIPYYQRFMGRFPDVRTLAGAALDDVLHLWSGLGYYARARNLHRAAQIICDHHGAEVPLDLELLRALPGIGRSTGGAILALSAGVPCPILDGNVKRVLTRLHGIDGWPGKPEVERELWRLAERYTPRRRPATYTQAVIDLGATVCTRHEPACHGCPVARGCEAYREGRQADYPAPRPRALLPVRDSKVLIIHEAGTVLLERRPPTGIWGGLWSFPEWAGWATPEEWSQRNLGFGIVDPRPGPAVRHTFSHFHLEVTPVYASLRGSAMRVMEDAGRVWYKIGRPQPLGITALVKRLLPMLWRGSNGGRT